MIDTEKMSHETKWLIKKYASDEDFEADNPYEVSEIEGNVLLNEGINEFITLGCGAGGTAYDNGNAYIGVGDSAAAESPAQTGLQGTNKTYIAMDGAYPTSGVSQQMVFKSTFGSSDANYAWNEFTVSNTSGEGGKNLNRKVSAQGTKASGQTWTVTLTITLS
jgi:hypothetical protein